MTNLSIQNLNQLLHCAELKILLFETLFFNPMLISWLIYTSYRGNPNAKLLSWKLGCYCLYFFNVICDLFITLLFKIHYKLHSQIKLLSFRVAWYNTIIISESYNKSIPFGIFQFQVVILVLSFTNQMTSK